MAVGDIKNTEGFEIIYRAKGAGTIAAGDAVALDANGLVIPATATTMGKHGILTGMTHVVGATTYYGVLYRGRIVATAGGALKPGDYVVSDANADVVAMSETLSATYVQAEAQTHQRVIGRYVRLESDNQYAPSDAAATNAAIIQVGDTP